MCGECYKNLPIYKKIKRRNLTDEEVMHARTLYVNQSAKKI